NVAYLGGADGGLWKTTDGGATWHREGNFDTQSIGAITVVPAHPHTVFVGTGEANTSSDSYWGAGIYRSLDAGSTFQKVGGSLFDQVTVFRIAVTAGTAHIPTTVYAATDRGLYCSPDNGVSWSLVLAPGGAADVRGNFVTDVTKIKRTAGKNIVAAVGWRAGDSNNGLWYSTDYGQTFTNVTAAADAAGFAPQANIGRIALATTRADPNLIYASVQDAVCLSSPAGFCPPGTVWNGLYKSTSGPTGPWVKVADSSKFASDPNSAQNPAHIGPLYQPGIGAWYNEYVIIDPTNPDHVITGLEEIYQTTDGGVTWQTIGRYWDFCIDSSTSWCNSDPPAPTTHPDQHAAAFAVTSAGTPKLYVGSDGGAWSQTGATDDNDHWTNLNDTLSITQPYYAAASAGANPTIYAGTQDNGSQKFDGTKWVEVFGGDGGDVTVEPQNPDRTIEEYVYLAMSASTDGGHVWHDASTPDSGSSSTARFISPFDLDPLDPHRVVALGKSAWVRTKGAHTTPNDWTRPATEPTPATRAAATWAPRWACGARPSTRAGADRATRRRTRSTPPGRASSAACSPRSAAHGTHWLRPGCPTGTSPRSPSTRRTRATSS
ncbi:MAG TPA: hypothetical protein DIT48_01470, partial [Actinobacteria bacterium]|nr:hypothetical protein [Actinomycetota bacterium]